MSIPKVQSESFHIGCAHRNAVGEVMHYTYSAKDWGTLESAKREARMLYHHLNHMVLPKDEFVALKVQTLIYSVSENDTCPPDTTVPTGQACPIPGQNHSQAVDGNMAQE